MANLLLVEDDPHLNNINRQALASEGYAVFCVTTVSDCLKALEVSSVDLMVIDIDLPDGNGLDLCKEIKENHNIPILFLTAMGENSDIVKGLDAGGDDYMTKPYDLEVLIARIKARLRPAHFKGTMRTLGKLQIDNVSGIARYDNKDLLLTQRELLLLWLLVDKKGEQIDRDELYQKVWGVPATEDYNALRVLISRVKTKLIDGGCKIQIRAERQKGYTLLI